MQKVISHYFYEARINNKVGFCLPELPADVIKMAKDIKPITEIKQSGNDFVITSKTPGKTVTNSFTIGKEAEITTMDGKKLKVCSLTCLLVLFKVLNSMLLDFVEYRYA